MKGIVLAGGSGTRLYPLTVATSKQMLPIYDKPMIYYPLSILMLAGIKDILIISTPEDQPNFMRLLGNGSDFGIKLTYKQQPRPDGIAQAFVIGEEFISNDSVALVLGDNILYGNGLIDLLLKAIENAKRGRATIFGYYVNDPKRFGIVEFDDYKKVLSIKEKPKKPKSNYAVIGLYFYDNRVKKIAKTLKPSPRGELEITDINQKYLDTKKLEVEVLGRGFAWIDTGTVKSFIEANEFIKIIEERQNIKIAALEEIAYFNQWISKYKLKQIAKKYSKSSYGQYLKKVADGKIIQLQSI